MKKRIALLLILIAGALGAWKGKPLYQHLMAHRLLRSAEQADARHDASEALRLFALAVNRAPNNLEILRQFAAFLDRAHRPEVLQIRARISRLEPENPESLLDFAEAALAVPDAKLARQLLSQKTPMQEKARYHHLLSVLHFISKELPEADAECEQAIRIEPGNITFRVNQATIRLSAPNPAARQSAIETLDGVPKNSPSRFGALQSLLRYSTLVSTEPKNLDAWLAEFRAIISPESPLFTIYLNAIQRWRPDQFDSQREAYSKAAMSGAETAYLAQKWIASRGAHEELIAFRQSLPAQWQTTPGSLLFYADALFALNRLEPLKESLATPGWNAIEPLKYAWEERLRRAAQPGEDAGATLARWNSLLASLENNAPWLLQLTELSEQWRWKAEYERSLWVLSEKVPANASQSLEGLTKFYLATENGAGLLQVLKKQLTMRPDDAALQNNLAFLSFLLGVETSRADRLASDLAKRFPKAPDIVATAAFGKFRKGEFAEGLSLYKPLDLNKLRGTASALSYGLLLAATNDRQAAEFLQNAERWIHFPEERQLLEEARAKLQ